MSFNVFLFDKLFNLLLTLSHFLIPKCLKQQKHKTPIFDLTAAKILFNLWLGCQISHLTVMKHKVNKIFEELD
jgi:hypothetical protein